MTRNGKIARLPREIRDELNQRLAKGELGPPLLAWLNQLPAVRELLAREFAGQVVNKQNLSDWRAGGFAEWQLRQELLAQTGDFAADAREVAGAAGGNLTDHLATSLAARYAATLTTWNGAVDDAFRQKLRALSGLAHDIAVLRRGDHSGARLKIEEERWEPERKKLAKARPRPGEEDPASLSPEERQRRINEIYGRPPDWRPPQ